MLPHFPAPINLPKAPKSVNWELDLITSSSYKQGEQALFLKWKLQSFLKENLKKERINWCDLKDLFYVIPARWDGNFFKMVGLKTGKEGEKFSLRLTNHLGRNQIFTWPKFVGSIELWSLLSATKFQNVFVQIAKYICPNCKMYLSKLQNVFVQIEKCICPSSTQWKQSEGPDASNVFPQWNTQLSLCT